MLEISRRMLQDRINQLRSFAGPWLSLVRRLVSGYCHRYSSWYFMSTMLSPFHYRMLLSWSIACHSTTRYTSLVPRWPKHPWLQARAKTETGAPHHFKGFSLALLRFKFSTFCQTVIIRYHLIQVEPDPRIPITFSIRFSSPAWWRSLDFNKISHSFSRTHSLPDLPASLPCQSLASSPAHYDELAGSQDRTGIKTGPEQRQFPRSGPGRGRMLRCQIESQFIR